MAKTCVFFTGTNCVGKTFLAKQLIRHFGGIDQERSDKELTVCCNGLVSFAGHYEKNKRFGGVDGFNSTKVLKAVVERALACTDVVICEGNYLHTIGLNLTNAMFVAERHLVVFLYAPAETINERLIRRAGKGITNPVVMSKQRQCCVAANKWQQMGVSVLAIDTENTPPSAEIDTIINKISELCGKDLR